MPDAPTTAGATALDQTVALLGRFADAPISMERREASLIITPSGEGTFPVSIYDEGDQAMIAAERWHTHYDDPIQVAFCAMWLLTPYYRVVHELKGGLLAAIWIERYEAEGWAGFEPVYFLNPEYPPDWETRAGETYYRRYFQQNVLPSPRPYKEMSPGVKLDRHGFPPGSTFGVATVQVDEPLGPDLF